MLIKLRFLYLCDCSAGGRYSYPNIWTVLTILEALAFVETIESCVAKGPLSQRDFRFICCSAKSTDFKTQRLHELPKIQHLSICRAVGVE